MVRIAHLCSSFASESLGALLCLKDFFRPGSELAGEPMPPAVIMQVLSITEDQLKAAQAEQRAPICSLDQFFEAM
jgi:hypothetical protein